MSKQATFPSDQPMMVGERVRLAREACYLSQTELAQLAHVSQGTLSDVEAGHIVSPSRLVVQRVAEATLFPESFFYLGALPDLPDGHFRKLKKGTVRVSKQVRAQTRQVVELVERSERALRLPPVRLEAVQELSDDPSVLERQAGLARIALGLGSRDPIPNLTRAAERAGIVVVRLPGEMRDHDGYSAWPDYGLGGRPIVALAAGHSGDRDRFTLAHEIGHLLLHTLRAGKVVPPKAEAEANRFAGALLIPREAAREAMRPPITLRVLMGVKHTYGASIQMAAQRALDLGLISYDHFVSLRKQLSARGWNTAEPVEVTSEQPLLIAKVIDYLAGTSGSTIARATKVNMPMFMFSAITQS